MTRIELLNERIKHFSTIKNIIEKRKNEGVTLQRDEEIEIENLEKQIEKIDNLLKEKEIELNNSNNEKKYRKMEFKLIDAINNCVRKREFTDTQSEVINAGKEEMRKAGVGFAGDIILPMNYRGAIQATVTSAGIENVPEDKLEIITALRNNLVTVKAGATYLTGLVGDVSIPVYSGSNVAWAGEIAAAADGAGTFSEKIYQPKRLTAYIDISKQFLLQDSNSAEAILQADLVAAITEKLESTILGNAAGSATMPAGIGNIITPGTVAVYADLIALEEQLESANVLGEYTYLMHPSAKAFFRSTPKVTGQAIFMLENNSINGYKVLTSNAIFTDGVIVGNWRDLVICQWGGIDITVDQYSQATNGKIRIIVNSYFDAKPRRNSSFALATV